MCVCVCVQEKAQKELQALRASGDQQMRRALDSLFVFPYHFCGNGVVKSYGKAK